MTRCLAATRALLIRDLRLLWPLVLLNAMLFLGRDLIPPSVDPQRLIGTLSTCATALLIVASVHLDAPASLRVDWLTRPVPPVALLAEKLIFLFSALLLPSFACQLVEGLVAATPPVEALRFAAFGHAEILPMALALVAVAALTRTLVGAAVVGLALAFLGAVIAPLSLALIGFPVDHLPVRGLSSLIGCVNIVGLAGSALVLWLQYVPRRTGAARVVFVATLLLLVAIQAIFVFSLSTAQS